MPEEKHIITELQELIPGLFARMSGNDNLQKLAYFMATVGVAAGVDTKGFIIACKRAAAGFDDILREMAARADKITRADEVIDEEVLVAFLNALATAITSLDDLPLRSDTFIQILDGVLGDLRNMPEIEGPAIYERVQVLRQVLDTSLDKVRLAKTPDGTQH